MFDSGQIQNYNLLPETEGVSLATRTCKTTVKLPRSPMKGKQEEMRTQFFLKFHTYFFPSCLGIWFVKVFVLLDDRKISKKG